MVDNNDAVLFWLEQEPVDGVEEVYLPPDTPTSRPSPKVLFQMNKINELKKQRAVERLRAYHFEQLADRRKQFAQCVVREQLPNQHQEILEIVDNASHMKEVLPDILKLLADIERFQEGSIKLDAFCIPEPIQDNLEIQQTMALKEKVRQSYSEFIDEKLHNQQQNLRHLYNHRLNLILPQQQQQHLQQVIESSPVPPLPPRVSQRDPRERIAEEYPPRNKRDQT